MVRVGAIIGSKPPDHKAPLNAVTVRLRDGCDCRALRVATLFDGAAGKDFDWLPASASRALSVVREAEVCRSGDVAAFGGFDDAAGGCDGGETFVERSGSHPASGAQIGEWLLLGGIGKGGGDAAPAIRMTRS